MVNIDDYPQLKMIAWNRPGLRTIAEPDALALYERNWRQVEEKAMDKHEQDLLGRLVNEYGHGILNV
jgi:hypothetical protein